MNKETREKMLKELSKNMPAPETILKAKNNDDSYEEAMILLALSELLDWDDIKMITELKEASVKENIKKFEEVLKEMDSAE